MHCYSYIFLRKLALTNLTDFTRLRVRRNAIVEIATVYFFFSVFLDDINILSSTNLTFIGTATRSCISVGIVDDFLIEEPEIFSFSLGSTPIGPQYNNGTPESTVLTINDNDGILLRYIQKIIRT